MSYDSFMSGYDCGARSAPKATAPFLVFADRPGTRPPSVKHDSRDVAEKEAQRLAALNPGVNFYVVGSLSVTSVPKAQPSTRSLV